MQLILTLLILGCSLVALPKIANGQENIYTFTSDLESFTAGIGNWQWSNRETFPWQLPDGPDGFAVQYMPGEGDILYESEVDVQYGLDYEITYYISSEEAGTTILRIQRLDENGAVLDDIAEYQSDPSSFEWATVSGSFGASGAPSRFGVFCQTAGINLVQQPFYGCAIDVIVLEYQLEPTTTTEVTTTSAPDTSEPATTQPSAPGTGIDFNFDNGTNGWVLGSSNGANWLRISSTFISDVEVPSSYVLALFPYDVYAGTVLATSPRLRVGDSGVVTVRVEFFMRGSPEYPVYLKLRRRYSYTTYDEELILNMDSFGDQLNTMWLVQAQMISGLTPGDEFNIVLEGNLGIDKDFSVHEVYVSRVYLEGLTVVPYEEPQLFNFDDGLVGWKAGSMDGGKWVVLSYNRLPPSLGIPAPTSEFILLVDRYDIHSGVITIESPPLEIVPGTTKFLQIRLLIKGSQVYPVIFRMGLKTVDGLYDLLPFVDLTPQGDADSQVWSTLGRFTEIPVNPRASYFQLVFEADLGGDMNNFIAIDGFSILTLPAGESPPDSY